MNDNNKRINILDYCGGFLTKEELDGPKVVTIKQIRAEDVDGSSKPKLVCSFEEMDKQLVLNSTNLRALAQIFGTGIADELVGKRFVLYVDPAVEFGGKRIGGLRVAAIPVQEPRPSMPETAVSNVGNGGFVIGDDGQIVTGSRHDV